VYFEIQKVLKLLTSQGGKVATIDDIVERYMIGGGELERANCAHTGY
jgi:hypothetical protein